ncbi:MAG TPA: ferritin family protein, partial [Candidatus Udaeobacter sp.]|nr:ferritin family protein [Candidatus Udaeobacter sp.]
MAQETVPKEAVQRLREAWRGEVEARAMYSILADRETDPRRAQIIRAIADAEASHRQRIEKRLRELGEPIPEMSSVKLSWLKRLQARVAPVETVIARMEAGEQAEITDRYKRPTGDADTDAVLLAIRAEEQGHSRSLETMQ